MVTACVARNVRRAHVARNARRAWTRDGRAQVGSLRNNISMLREIGFVLQNRCAGAGAAGRGGGPCPLHRGGTRSGAPFPPVSRRPASGRRRGTPRRAQGGPGGYAFLHVIQRNKGVMRNWVRFAISPFRHHPLDPDRASRRRLVSRRTHPPIRCARRGSARTGRGPDRGGSPWAGAPLDRRAPARPPCCRPVASPPHGATLAPAPRTVHRTMVRPARISRHDPGETCGPAPAAGRRRRGCRAPCRRDIGCARRRAGGQHGRAGA